MTDFLTKKERSERMSLIRSKWTAPERIIHNYLKGQKIKHKMHPKIVGNPDILLPDSNVVIFLDGCFWHKCPKCFRMPESRKSYWIPKIEKNVKRDKLITRKLKKDGWKVLRFWEHENKKHVCQKIYQTSKK